MDLSSCSFWKGIESIHAGSRGCFHGAGRWNRVADTYTGHHVYYCSDSGHRIYTVCEKSPNRGILPTSPQRVEFGYGVMPNLGKIEGSIYIPLGLKECFSHRSHSSSLKFTHSSSLKFTHSMS